MVDDRDSGNEDEDEDEEGVLHVSWIYLFL